MNIEIDDDVKAVLEMMVQSIPAARLVSVANGVQKIAPILWGQFPADEIQPMQLRHTAI